MVLYLAGAVALVVVSFSAGLFLFKIKQRWCPECGTTLSCSRCARADLHHLSPGR